MPHVYVPPQPLATEPHLPRQAAAIAVGTHWQTDFLLSQAFLSGPPTITYSANAADLGTPAAAAITTMVVDREKGLLKDWVTDYTGHYVQVSYSYGFDADGGNAESYNLSQVPAWLQECAKLQALILLADAPSVTAAQIKLDSAIMTRQLLSIVGKKSRYAPMAVLPM